MLRACGEHVATNIQTSCFEHFFHVANTFSMLRPSPSSPDILYMLRAMLRACGEHVATTIQTSDARFDRQLGGCLIFFPIRRLIRSITVCVNKDM
jgi:hypothetical protein